MKGNFHVRFLGEGRRGNTPPLPDKRYVVRLTNEEREHLQKLVSTEKATAYKIKHANILLQVDADGSNWTDEQAAQAFSCHRNTVAHVR